MHLKKNFLIQLSLMLGMAMCSRPALAWVNGDFEAGTLAGWTVSTTGCGSAGISTGGWAPHTAPGQLWTVYNGANSAALDSCYGTFNHGDSAVISQTSVVPSSCATWLNTAVSGVFSGHHYNLAEPYGSDAYALFEIIIGGSTVVSQRFSWYDNFLQLMDPGLPYSNDPNGPWKYLPWTIYNYDLSAYAGQTVTVRLSTFNCYQWVHPSHAYLDLIDWSCSSTMSPTRTWTISPTPSASPQFTATPSFSASPTFSATPSATFSPTATPTCNLTLMPKLLGMGGLAQDGPTWDGVATTASGANSPCDMDTLNGTQYGSSCPWDQGKLDNGMGLVWAMNAAPGSPPFGFSSITGVVVEINWKAGEYVPSGLPLNRLDFDFSTDGSNNGLIPSSGAGFAGLGMVSAKTGLYGDYSTQLVDVTSYKGSWSYSDLSQIRILLHSVSPAVYNYIVVDRIRVFVYFDCSGTATPTMTSVPATATPTPGCSQSDSLDNSNLASFWTDQDVRGGSTTTGGQLRLTNYFIGAATNLSTTAMKAHMLLQPASGSFDVQVKVTSTAGFAGLIALTNPSDPATVRALNIWNAGWIQSYNQGTQVTNDYVPAPPAYLRMVYSAGSLSYYRSTDGVAWTLQSTQAVALGANFYVGLISGNTNITLAARDAYLDDFVVNSSTSGLVSDNFNGSLAPQWISRGRGGSTVETGTLTHYTTGISFGTDMSGPATGATRDGPFRYTYQNTCISDFDAAVRVSATAGGSPVGGLMVRNGVDDDAPFVSITYQNASPNFTPILRYRSSVGGAIVNVALANIANTNPWVRLNKTGNTYTAYYSNNGSSWTAIPSASVSVNLGSSCLQLGLSTWGTAANYTQMSYNYFSVTCTPPTPTPSSTHSPSPTASPTATPSVTPQMAITKSASASVVTIGDTLTFCINWQNDSSGLVTMNLWDTLSSALSYRGCDNNCSQSGQLVWWSFPAAAGSAGQVCVWTKVTGYPP